MVYRETDPITGQTIIITPRGHTIQQASPPQTATAPTPTADTGVIRRLGFKTTTPRTIPQAPVTQGGIQPGETYGLPTEDKVYVPPNAPPDIQQYIQRKETPPQTFSQQELITQTQQQIAEAKKTAFFDTVKELYINPESTHQQQAYLDIMESKIKSTLPGGRNYQEGVTYEYNLGGRPATAQEIIDYIGTQRQQLTEYNKDITRERIQSGRKITSLTDYSRAIGSYPEGTTFTGKEGRYTANLPPTYYDALQKYERLNPTGKTIYYLAGLGQAAMDYPQTLYKAATGYIGGYQRGGLIGGTIGTVGGVTEQVFTEQQRTIDIMKTDENPIIKFGKISEPGLMNVVLPITFGAMIGPVMEFGEGLEGISATAFNVWQKGTAITGTVIMEAGAGTTAIKELIGEGETGSTLQYLIGTGAQLGIMGLTMKSFKEPLPKPGEPQRLFTGTPVDENIYFRETETNLSLESSRTFITRDLTLEDVGLTQKATLLKTGQEGPGQIKVQEFKGYTLEGIETEPSTTYTGVLITSDKPVILEAGKVKKLWYGEVSTKTPHPALLPGEDILVSGERPFMFGTATTEIDVGSSVFLKQSKTIVSEFRGTSSTLNNLIGQTPYEKFFTGKLTGEKAYVESAADILKPVKPINLKNIPEIWRTNQLTEPGISSEYFQSELKITPRGRTTQTVTGGGITKSGYESIFGTKAVSEYFGKIEPRIEPEYKIEYLSEKGEIYSKMKIGAGEKETGLRGGEVTPVNKPTQVSLTEQLQGIDMKLIQRFRGGLSSLKIIGDKTAADIITKPKKPYSKLASGLAVVNISEEIESNDYIRSPYARQQGPLEETIYISDYWTGQKPGQRTRTDSKIGLGIIDIIELGELGKTKEDQFTGNLSGWDKGQKPIQEPDTTTRLGFNEIQITKTGTRQQQRQQQDTLQELEQNQIFDFTQITSEINKPPNITPRFRLIPGLPGNEDKEQKKHWKQKPVYTGYIPEVHERGRWTRLTSKPLSRRDAESILAEALDETKSAVGKLKPVRGKPQPPNINVKDISTREYKFKRKGDTLIEKRQYRIDSPGEIRGITAKGWLANKRKGQSKRINFTNKIDFTKLTNIKRTNKRKRIRYV